MRVRWIGLTLALALVGGATGFALARMAEEDPRVAAGAAPVAAQSPSYPVNEYDVLPDPGIAPLAPDLPSHVATFAAGGLRMTASVPIGWRRARSSFSTVMAAAMWPFMSARTRLITMCWAAIRAMR